MNRRILNKKQKQAKADYLTLKLTSIPRVVISKYLCSRTLYRQFRKSLKRYYIDSLKKCDDHHVQECIDYYKFFSKRIKMDIATKATDSCINYIDYFNRIDKSYNIMTAYKTLIKKGDLVNATCLIING